MRICSLAACVPLWTCTVCTHSCLRLLLPFSLCLYSDLPLSFLCCLDYAAPSRSPLSQTYTRMHAHMAHERYYTFPQRAYSKLSVAHTVSRHVTRQMQEAWSEGWGRGGGRRERAGVETDRDRQTMTALVSFFVRPHCNFSFEIIKFTLPYLTMTEILN